MKLTDKLEILADAANPFIVAADAKPSQGAAASDLLRRHLADAPQQMNPWPELKAA